MDYKYKAMNANGELVEGIFSGNTVEEVAKMLRNNKSFPVSIEEYVKTGTKEIIIGGNVGSKELAFLCRQMHAMLNAGSTVVRCLDIVKRQTENKRLHIALNQMHADVQKGRLLSQAMLEHPNIFPNLMVYMIESGEISGTLDDILLRLAIYFEKDAKIKGKIRSAMIYPIVLMLLSTAVVTFLVTVILPTFTSMFEKSGVELPLITQILLNISDFIREKTILLIALIIIFIVLIRQYVISDSGRTTIDKIKLTIPYIRKLNITILTARFARNLSTMLISGVPLLTSLENVGRLINNRVAENLIYHYREEIQKGSDLYQVIRDSNFFPPMLDNMIEIGQESGQLDTILEKTADYYDEEAEQALQRLVTLFEPLMIIVMAVVIGFIVIAMALPMFGIVDTIG